MSLLPLPGISDVGGFTGGATTGGTAHAGNRGDINFGSLQDDFFKDDNSTVLMGVLVVAVLGGLWILKTTK